MLQKLASQVPGMLYQFQWFPDGLFRFPYASKGIHEIYETSPEEVAEDARLFLKRVHPEDVDRIVRTIEESARDLSVWREDYRVILPVRGERWLHGESTPERMPDGSVLWHGYIIDITERKREEVRRLELERHMMDAQKLESLGLLAGGLAHDFNNLLTVIAGNVEQAMLSIPKSSPDHQGLRDALTASRRAAELTRQMLAYAGRGPMILQPVYLSGLIRENINLIRAMLPTHVELKLDLMDDVFPVQADPGQLQQMLLNLVANAVEALPGGRGQIQVQTEYRIADAQELSADHLGAGFAPGPCVVLEVADNGVGMSAAAIEQIFDPFYSTKGLGRGLGLAAVHGIMRGHGGAILVDTSPSQGTSFRLFLPPGAKTIKPGPRTAGSTAPVGPACILLADDEPMILSIGQRMLECLGYEVIPVASGADAFRIYREQQGRIHACILDYAMPDIDGVVCAREILKVNPSALIYLSSGYAEQEVGKQVDLPGIVGFLQKPYDLRHLQEELGEVFGG